MDSYIKIDGWKSNIQFSSAHIISGHDKCGRLHGHTYAIHAKIYGKKNKEGIIIDFSLIKSALKNIADELDHRILIPEKNMSITVDETEVKMSSNEKHYVFPKEDCILLPIECITAENLAEYVLSMLVKKIRLPKNTRKIEIGIDEGLGQGARVEENIG